MGRFGRLADAERGDARMDRRQRARKKRLVLGTTLGVAAAALVSILTRTVQIRWSPSEDEGQRDHLMARRTHGNGRRWTRDEDLAVLYARHIGLGRFHPDIVRLAAGMERTEASIWMRRGNFESLDPSTPGVGLRSAAKLTQDVWAEYQRNPERVLRQARAAFEKIRGIGG